MADTLKVLVWGRQADLAWAAGFFDGEGCVRVHHSKGDSYRLALSVSQADERPLLHLRNILGGRINDKSPARPNRRRQWQWAASTREAASALRAMLPYLVLKNGEASLALMFQAMLRVEYGNRRALSGWETAERASVYEALGEYHQLHA